MLNQNKNQFCRFQAFILLIIILSSFIFSKSSAQVYSFDEIRENFIRERPQTGNDTIRQDCFGSIDDLIIGRYPPLNPDARKFFIKMLEKAILEIQTENVVEGATIWQIYNHDFVVKTPSMILGFDLYDYFQTDEFLKLANILKVYSYDDCGNQSESYAEIDFTSENLPPRIIDYYPSDADTVAAFSGIPKLFRISTMDPNKDELFYSWEIDQSPIQNATNATLSFMVAGLNSGFHQLTVIVKDKEFSRQKSWTIDYQAQYAIVDNEDSLVYSDEGAWSTLKSNSAYGLSYRRTPKSNLSDWALFSFYPEKPGEYDLFEMIPRLNASNDVIYSIFLNDQLLDAIHINPNEEKGSWKKIGHYNFPPAAKVQVKLENSESATVGTYLFADAIKFSYGEILAAPVLIEPVHWQEIPADNPTFRWESVAGATSYQIQISPDKSFEKDIVDSSTVIQNQFTSESLKEGTTYFWRVRAANVSKPGYWSSVYRFRISGINITDRLVAHYPLDGSPADSVGDSHGTLTGDIRLASDRFGKADQAYSFDGNGDYISFPESEAFTSIDRQITVSAWIYPHSLAFETGVMLHDRFWRLFLGENGSVFGNIFNEVGEEQRVGSSVGAALETWTLVAFTYDCQNINVYLNGEHSGKLAYPAARIGEANVQSSQVLGKGFGNSQNDFNGSIDEVRVYDRALSQEEIGALYLFTSSIDTRHDEANLPIEYLLAQNYPNPFNPTTTICYELPKAAQVTLKIYDIIGKEIQTLVNKHQNPGRFAIKFDSHKLTSGIYFYKLQIGSDFVETKKMLLLR